MDVLQISARFPSIPSDKLGEFKRMAAEALAIAKGDPGCLQYDWFLSGDETVCEVRETYASSDAVLAHLGEVGALIGPMMEIAGGLEVECFGSPSQALLEATAAFKPDVY